MEEFWKKMMDWAGAFVAGLGAILGLGRFEAWLNGLTEAAKTLAQVILRIFSRFVGYNLVVIWRPAMKGAIATHLLSIAPAIVLLFAYNYLWWGLGYFMLQALILGLAMSIVDRINDVRAIELDNFHVFTNPETPDENKYGRAHEMGLTVLFGVPLLIIVGGVVTWFTVMLLRANYGTSTLACIIMIFIGSLGAWANVGVLFVTIRAMTKFFVGSTSWLLGILKKVAAEVLIAAPGITSENVEELLPKLMTSLETLVTDTNEFIKTRVLAPMAVIFGASLATFSLGFVGGAVVIMVTFGFLGWGLTTAFSEEEGLKNYMKKGRTLFLMVFTQICTVFAVLTWGEALIYGWHKTPRVNWLGLSVDSYNWLMRNPIAFFMGTIVITLVVVRWWYKKNGEELTPIRVWLLAPLVFLIVTTPVGWAYWSGTEVYINPSYTSQYNGFPGACGNGARDRGETSIDHGGRCSDDEVSFLELHQAPEGNILQRARRWWHN